MGTCPPDDRERNHVERDRIATYVAPAFGRNSYQKAECEDDGKGVYETAGLP
jgi:hypothetical protein